MIHRLHVHNFRCLENFELPISGKSSVLLIGKNAAGKTTVGRALEILQKIARGTNRARDLIEPKDLARARTDVPVRFEIEVALKAVIYQFTIGFEYPRGFKEALEKHGELKRVSIEVDPVLEIAEFADRSVNSQGPALLFEKPKGSRVPVLINAFASMSRMELALPDQRAIARALPIPPDFN